MKISMSMAALALPSIVWAAPAVAVPADFAARADAWLAQAWPADGPGISVIVTEHGQPVYARGRGLADMDGHAPVTPDSVFRIGSITKQFTAAIILQLVDEGRLSLDDPVSRFVPGLPSPTSGATIAHLLSHTSGAAPFGAVAAALRGGTEPGRVYETQELIAPLLAAPAIAEPGQAFAYNNGGYILLGAVIESLTGMPWHQAIEARIVRPLGLTRIRHGVEETGLPDMASGYSRGAGGVQPARPVNMSFPHAAGALLGSAGDLAVWAQALHHGRVISRESHARMIAPTILSSGATVPYGFGTSLSDVRGRAGMGHNGAINGFMADSIYFPESGIFVAVLANTDQPAVPPGIVLRRLAAMALGDPYPAFEAVAPDPAAIEPLLGVYGGEDGTERVFFMREGRLHTRRGETELEVFAAGEDRFFYGPANLSWFRIVRDADGAPVMEMHPNGAIAAERTTRRGPVPADAPAPQLSREALARFVGDYTLGRTPVVIAWTDGGGIALQVGGQTLLPLVAVRETEFRVARANIRVVFPNGNGPATHLTIHQAGREMLAVRAAPSG